MDHAYKGGEGYKGDNRAGIPVRMVFFDTASPRGLGSYIDDRIELLSISSDGRTQTMMEKPHAHRLRKGRVSETNRIYFITTATSNRQPVFVDFNHARQLIQVLRENAALQRAQTLCFVVMPDHLHWLMQLEKGCNLSQVIRSVKSLSSRRIGRNVWQKGFYDRALRREEDLRSLARYIVANPIRARLVESVSQYPHWDSVWL
jgi:REP element-mobilizing transposase RayT